MPWQWTGNHWIALPCIHPADASVHAIGMLHRGARAAIEFAGSTDFVDGGGSPLARPMLTIDGVAAPLAEDGLAWERAVGWLPTFTATVQGITVRGTIFAPFGRDADLAGAVYALSIENRSTTRRAVGIALEGMLGARQLRVRSARPFDDVHRVAIVGEGDDASVIMEGSALPGLVALAIGADEGATLWADAREGRYRVSRELEVAAGRSVQVAFFLAAGPERDGARATLGVMRRRGWRELLGFTRDALQSLEQVTGHESVDRVVNRNLLFAYFFAVGRAIDDAQYYMVRTRAPWHPEGVTIRDWQALMWILPAVQLADAGLARELLLRACELHGYAPGQGTRYFDGTLFAAGFSVEGAAAYAIATDRYIRDTGDEQIVEDPILADTLYMAADDLKARRDERVALYGTELLASGVRATLPFTLHGNAVVALALDAMRRTLDEETAKGVEDPAAVRAAMQKHFSDNAGGKGELVAAVDLAGRMMRDDDAVGSVLWLPFFEALDRSDSRYRRTVRALPPFDGALARWCGGLVGPDAAPLLDQMRRWPLDQGVAAGAVDAEGRAIGDGADAALAGLLAYCAWFAVHGLGVSPT
ncbi:MAG: hypothetical protein MUF00_13560 [Gemmatimonadaceae bacterium]|nr:hypothetical protein [Gemmatimonadaceae bacterium]